MAAPKLSKELQAKVCEYLEKGNTRRAAAALVRIDEVTFSRWYHRGAREEKGAYHDFFLSVNEAEARCQDSGVETIRAGSVGNPKLVLNFLGRRFPGEWGRRDNVETISVEDMAAKQQATREILIERLEKLLPENEAEEEPVEDGASV